MANDKDYNRLIHSQRWLRLRRDILSSHPLCERCESEGYVTPATEVHHITPVEYGINLMEKQRLMFDPHNLQALCRSCHVLTHTEIGRSGKEATRRRVKEHVARLVSKYFE